MRYVITGGSGYIGSRLIERLLAREDTERIAICDIKPPPSYRPRTEYRRLDVRDGEAARELLTEERPDALLHLAFVLNPIHDDDTMYDIDVGGCQRILEAASAAEVPHVLVTSSTTAYGAFPDNPVPLTEEHPLRGVPDFEYARDKTESDRLCQLWALQHPDRTMTIVRPCIVLGPNVDNYIVRYWTKQPFMADFGTPDPPLQFVHEDDLVEAIEGLLVGRHGGAFNVTGDGYVTGRECAQMVGIPTRRVPFRPYWKFGELMWRLRLSEAPPSMLHFALHPWVASNEKVKKTLDWEPKYSSREAFEIAMRTHGALPESEERSLIPTAPAPAGV